MAQEQEQFKKSVSAILEAVMFENWLRFYFITPMTDEKESEDADPHLFLTVPDKGMNNIKALYPNLLPMAEFMNHKEVTFEVSQQAVCTFVVENLDGVIMERDTAGSIMDSMAFQLQLQLFNTWVQLHENQLESSFFDFGSWRDLFAEWKDSKAGKDLREKLALSLQKPLAGTETIQ